ncbi:expressed unknown protein [Seminavis robusta]|uniref:Uncharacterized protein n=1 Tax=Seminavis robusta TaxID=568900 RepID=A0A9N8DRE6_9STRA|nr:expressed unknown protein [Seminavis robusta]|eukprot:Sro227_g092420.1 n/a (99) ;mRNA; f:77004-77409
MGDYFWQHQLNEWRHSPCLMKPVTLGMLITMAIFWIVTMALQFLLGCGVSYGTHFFTGHWLIEFLIPYHCTLGPHSDSTLGETKVPLEDKAANYHSRL